MPTPSHSDTREQPLSRMSDLLSSAATTLCGEDLAEVLTVYAELDGLSRRAKNIPVQTLRRFEKISAYMTEPLADVVCELKNRPPQNRKELRKLRTIVRNLACTFDHVVEKDSVIALSPQDLVVAYSNANISELVVTCAASFNELAALRNIDFQLEVAPQTLAEVDVEKLQRILVNLLFNAFKHTAEGGRIGCSLRTDAETESVVLVVEDSGSEYGSVQLRGLSDPLYFLDKDVFLRTKIASLNLTTLKAYASLHGGTLDWFANKPCGVMFAVELPKKAPTGVAFESGRLEKGYASQMAELAAAELGAENELAMMPLIRDERPSILVIAPHRSFQRVLFDSVRNEYNLAFAADGTEGLQKADTLRPDLILVDLGSFAGGETTFVRTLRNRDTLLGVSILVIASKEHPLLALELFEAGAQDVIHKPVLLSEVLVRVRNWVANKRAKDVLSELVDRHQTDLVKVADEVAKHQDELKVALDQVEAARGLAESASRVKSNFLRMMSHELKTPITAMQLQMRVLERDSSVVGSAKVQEGVTRIWRSSRRLLHLVDTMLEWARIESGRCQLAIEPFNVEQLLEEIENEFRSHLNQKGLQLETHQSARPITVPSVTSDRRLVRLVLTHLMERAIQVTDQGGIGVLAEYRPSTYCITVFDQAEKITHDQYQELFQPSYSNADLRRVSGSGSGLGLAIVRDIALAVGGDLRLEPAETEGNKLIFEFPSLAPQTKDRSPSQLLQQI